MPFEGGLRGRMKPNAVRIEDQRNLILGDRPTRMRLRPEPFCDGGQRRR